jgi:hypothetical protein
LVGILGQHANWLDVRHVKTMAWMMVGLIESGLIGLTAWSPYTHSRAQFAQSTVRRFRRWLDNERIQVNRLYAPLIQQALSTWREHTIYLALDTTLLWNKFCVVRISVLYRGRAVPLVWCTLEQSSASVAFDKYRTLLDEAAVLLVAYNSQVVFLADRGFADTDLMAYLTERGWRWHVRLKTTFWVHATGCRPSKTSQLMPAKGEAIFLHNIFITGRKYGPVHLAVAYDASSKERWIVVSSHPTHSTTLDEYGRRFDIEESFLDDKSNGFQLESSLIRSADALSRLCFVLAITTLYLVSQGTLVAEQGRRRWVDAHWFRGSSYFKIGWNWVRKALSRGWELIDRLYLSGIPDPEPARSSRKCSKRSVVLPVTVCIDFASVTHG